MNRVEVQSTSTGFTVSGDIRFSNVLRLRHQGDRCIQAMSNPTVEIDLSHVNSTDTSGLSLLLRWVHFAKNKNKKINYKSIPASLLKMAKVCGISNLING